MPLTRTMNEGKRKKNFQYIIPLCVVGCTKTETKKRASFFLGMKNCLKIEDNLNSLFNVYHVIAIFSCKFYRISISIIIKLKI